MKLLYNATVYTQDDVLPKATALVIDRERIVAVGGKTLLEEFPHAKKEDMGGLTLIPGLTDAHIHLQMYALGLQKLNCETTTRAECLRRVADRAQILAAGEWLLGHGWSQNEWPEGFGTLAQLDEASPNNPAFLTAKSLHAAWANSSALKLAGVTANTPDPQNGKILRDEQGQPTGILLESAVLLVEKSLPSASPAQVEQAILTAQTSLWQMGLTGAHDFDRRECFMALQSLRRKGQLGLRITKSIPVELLPHASALGMQTGFGDDMLRIGSVKVFMDGALGPRTASMFKSYLNEPGNRGILNMDGEDLYEIGVQAVQSGLSVAVHAIGDRANHEVLNAFEHLRTYEQTNHLPARRHRVEHMQALHPNDARRPAQLNLVASMQPIHALSDMTAAERLWGDRSRYAYAWRTQLDNGTVLAFGSDAPVENPNPFWGLRACVTRRRADGSPSPSGWFPEQKLTFPEALGGYTLGPAFAAGMEDRLGKLKAGFLADMIAFNTDPYQCDPDDFLTIRPVCTMVNGEWVWKGE